MLRITLPARLFIPSGAREVSHDHTSKGTFSPSKGRSGVNEQCLLSFPTPADSSSVVACSKRSSFAAILSKPRHLFFPRPSTETDAQRATNHYPLPPASKIDRSPTTCRYALGAVSRRSPGPPDQAAPTGGVSRRPEKRTGGLWSRSGGFHWPWRRCSWACRVRQGQTQAWSSPQCCRPMRR